MDFNNNGSWGDVDEHVFIDEPLPGGQVSFQIPIPDEAVLHEIFSRFRFSTVPGLPYMGIAIDGEVEDYYVDLTETGVQIPEPDKTVPETFCLYQNFPNPFNPVTEIGFTLPENCEIELTIYNTSGQLIQTVVSGPYIAGEHNIIWNGRDQDGVTVASGLYIYVLRAGDMILKNKMLLLK
jgi:hypothetical protein